MRQRRDAKQVRSRGVHGVVHIVRPAVTQRLIGRELPVAVKVVVPKKRFEGMQQWWQQALKERCSGSAASVVVLETPLDALAHEQPVVDVLADRREPLSGAKRGVRSSTRRRQRAREEQSGECSREEACSPSGSARAPPRPCRPPDPRRPPPHPPAQRQGSGRWQQRGALFGRRAGGRCGARAWCAE
jgi:hypothetical protein